MKLVNIIGLHDNSDKSRVVDYMCSTFYSNFEVCCKFDKEPGVITLNGDNYYSEYLPSAYLNKRIKLLDCSGRQYNSEELKNEIEQNCVENRFFIDSKKEGKYNTYGKSFLDDRFYVISESKSTSEIKYLFNMFPWSYSNIGVFKIFNISENEIKTLDLPKIKRLCKENNIKKIAITRIDLAFKLFSFKVKIGENEYKTFNGCPLEGVTPENLHDNIIYFLGFIEKFLNLRVCYLNFGREREYNVYWK